jgi:hypothetical protein
MSNKKFHHVTIQIEDTVLKDLIMELGLAVMTEQAGGVRDSFVRKLVVEVGKGETLVRFDYKDNTRGQ